MTFALERGLAQVERFCCQPEGLSLLSLADELDLLHGACHLLFAELQLRGWARPLGSQDDHVIMAKLAPTHLGFLSSSELRDD